MTIKVSVVICVYNRENYIKDAVESILNQSYKDFELIIVDDGSKDNTVNIIESFSDNRINLLINEENKGISYSRNRAFDVAKGDFIAVFDSDDICMFDRLEKQVGIMQQKPDIDICGGWIEHFDQDKKEIWTNHERSVHIKTSLLFDSTVFHPTALIRKEAFVKFNVRYNENLKSSVDYDLWVQFALAGAEFYNLPEILVKYRKHEKQISTGERKHQTSNATIIRKKILEKMGIFPNNEELDIHESIGTLSIENDKEYLKKINKWFNLLIKANKKSSLYDENALDYIICDYWLSISKIHSKKGYMPFYYFLMSTSPLKTKFKIINDRLKILFKKRLLAKN